MWIFVGSSERQLLDENILPAYHRGVHTVLGSGGEKWLFWLVMKFT